nr:unnamed protein product [Digitaria exilis]
MSSSPSALAGCGSKAITGTAKCGFRLRVSVSRYLFNCPRKTHAHAPRLLPHSSTLRRDRFRLIVQATPPSPPAGAMGSAGREAEVTRADFPGGFVFGVATSAHQIEGARREGGKGDNIWDVFTDNKERVLDGSNADIAVDHYHRYKEDIELMASLGFGAYRFSISWARIFPDGLGEKVNEQGVAFYNDLINFMIAKEKWNSGEKIGERAASEWLFIVPWGLHKLLNYVAKKYDNPAIYITENGMDEEDDPSTTLEQALNDTTRVGYFKGYLASVAQAIKDGVDIRGYFAWSFLDNFEWAMGYTKRFGIVYVDYKNGLSRHPKASALWFSRFLKGEAAENKADAN